MLESFQNNLLSLVAEPENKKFLLAVSGGVDSVVMTSMFRDSGLHYGIAHCNFQLRGKESEGDLKFLEELAKVNDAPFYSIGFDTENYAKKNKVSIQMAARELRYAWFNEICREKKYDYIVTAHHADDAIETFFINLFRGTGISGLHGIKAINGNVIRPMLIYTKNDIRWYAKKKKLTWREDSSNEFDDYFRNKVRHYIVPALEKVDEGYYLRLLQLMEILASTGEVYKSCIKKETDKFIKRAKVKVEIDLDLFEKLSHPALYLFEIVKEFDFNYEQCLLISDCVKRKIHSGKTFYSGTHRILIDRKHLSILPVKPGEEFNFVITHDTIGINLDYCFCFFKHFNIQKKYKPGDSPREAFLDFDKLSFPLEVRKWKPGDRFYPLGMNLSKKVSDFLIDNKVSMADKEKVYVLTSNGKIVWIIGYRIDDRFKVTGNTKKVYFCQIKKRVLPEDDTYLLI